MIAIENPEKINAFEKELRHPETNIPPSNYWLYHDASGQLVMVVARYEINENPGKKIFLPWTWNGKRWVAKGLAGPRPLYKLPYLLLHDELPVLVTEGCKAADAAGRRDLPYITTTSSGGSNAYAMTDWEPLKGRQAVIWPDNDKPGRHYADEVAARIYAAGGFPRIVEVPLNWSDRWDLADENPPGVSDSDIKAMCERAKAWSPIADATTVVVDLAEKREQRKPRKERQKAQNVPDDGFIRDIWTGKIDNTNPHNLTIALEKMGITLQYNELRQRMEVCGLAGHGPLLTDAAIDKIYVELWKLYDLKYTRADLEALINAECEKRRIHPIKEYVDSLEWDGIERVEEWLMTYLGAKDDSEGVNRAIGTNVLVAAVRRIRQPGAKYDTMMVIEGPQGTGKSTAIKTLCPEPSLFTDNVSLHHAQREIIELTSGKWIVEIGELAGMKRADIEHVKAMLSRQVDEAREAYGRRTTERPRQCIFIGSTNEAQYLLENGGNRRFLPVRIGKIDIEALKRDRDQLWAEAAYWEKENKPLTLPDEITEALSKIQSAREVVDEIDSLIHPWLEREYPPFADEIRDQKVTIFDVASSALTIDRSRFDSIIQKRIAASLRRAHWQFWKKSNGVRWWKRIGGAETAPYGSQNDKEGPITQNLDFAGRL